MTYNKFLRNIYLTTVACLFFTAILPFSSCTDKKHHEYLTCVIPDSTMMDTSDKTTHVIHVGDKITNMPLCSQIVNINGKDKYLMLDETNIYVFDWESGNIEDSIPTKACGTLNNYSGFTYLSKDSIAIFNSTAMSLFIINGKGHVICETKIRHDDEDPTKNVSTITGLNACRINNKGNKFIVNGFILGCMTQAKEYGKIPVSEEINTENGTCRPIVTYPEIYTEKNWGTVYMNNVYTTNDLSGNTIYSFPIMNRILRYNADFTKCDTITMQSRYDHGINPCTKSQDEIEEDENLEKKYYISQLNYANIIFDPYRKIYIRAVEHPLSKWKIKDTFIKPMSFIMSDTNGKVLSETPIINGSKNMILSNMHIYSKGLAIATKNADEDNIYFTCFKIRQ